MFYGKYICNLFPLLLLVHMSYGLYELDVYRMFAYEQAESWVGSRI